MRINAKSLVRRLTPAATCAMERAVGLASRLEHAEVTVEHLLRAMLQEPDAPVCALLKEAGQDAQAWVARLDAALRAYRKQAERPVLSHRLLQWLSDTWLFASLDLAVAEIDASVLVLQLRRAPQGAYTAESTKEIDALALDDLTKRVTCALEADVVSSAVGDAGRPGDALARYTTSFTALAAAGKIDPVLGRVSEVRQLIDVLSRRRKNNPVIVGEPGVGKTALVEGLALAIVAGQTPEKLRGVDVRGLDMGMLQAGAGVRGEFEQRLQNVIQAVKQAETPIILFIDEAHTLIGAGGQAGGSDAANLLKPELARGGLRTIAATTWSEYKKYFEKDAALERRFHPVHVAEPSCEAAIDMLRGLAPRYARDHGVVIRDEAVVAAVQLSHRYVSGRRLPDKAIDVLDTAAARAQLDQAAPPAPLEHALAHVAALQRRADAIVRDIESGCADAAQARQDLIAQQAAAQAVAVRLTERWQSERAQVTALRTARVEAAQIGEDADKACDARARVIKALGEIHAVEDRLTCADVDARCVADVISGWTGIPVGNMQAAHAAQALALEQHLGARVLGQDAAHATVAQTVRAGMAGLKEPNAPLGVLLFVGPSGVGKTETALALADAIYGGERFMTTINMSEYQEKHTVSRLVGSPPGYVGFGAGGVLTEAVRQRPYTLVLLDECEKADIEVMNVFHQVFDKGTLNDGEGRCIDFRNTLIVLTSNLGAADIHALAEADALDQLDDVLRPTLQRHFKASLLGRMTVVPFLPFDSAGLAAVARAKLAALAKRLADTHGLAVHVDAAVALKLVAMCTQPHAGARQIDQAIREHLTPLLSRRFLEQRLTADEQAPNLQAVGIGIAADGSWAVTFT